MYWKRMSTHYIHHSADWLYSPKINSETQYTCSLRIFSRIDAVRSVPPT